MGKPKLSKKNLAKPKENQYSKWKMFSKNLWNLNKTWASYFVEAMGTPAGSSGAPKAFWRPSLRIPSGFWTEPYNIPRGLPMDAQVFPKQVLKDSWEFPKRFLECKSLGKHRFMGITPLGSPWDPWGTHGTPPIGIPWDPWGTHGGLTQDPALTIPYWGFPIEDPVSGTLQ